MTELLLALCEAAKAAEHSAELAFDEFPPDRDECTFVTIPHEFHAWGATWPNAWQRERTIALCTENPGTPWFEATYELVPQFALAASINRASAAELRQRGVRCEHLQLGYTSRWDSWRGDENVERELDVLYLGAADPRRDPLLASIGKQLWSWNCQFLVPPLEPRTRARPDFLVGSQKYARLASSRILLNLHRTTSSALEWMRFLEAISNGCVVVSEPCTDGAPLIPGEHYISVPAAEMAGAVERLLQAPDRLAGIREQSYEFVRRELPMTSTIAGQLSEMAHDLPRRPQSLTSSPASRSGPAPDQPGRVSTMTNNTSKSTGSPLGAQKTPLTILTNPTLDSIRSRLRAATRRLRTRRVAEALHHSSTFSSIDPKVSVLCVAAPDGDPSFETVESVASSQYRKIELLVSASPRNQREIADHLDRHGQLSASLLEQRAQDGVGASLNRLVGHARGEYLFVLDGRGAIVPSALGRLAGCLDATPGAAFAFSMVGLFDEDRPLKLLGSVPWEPERLKLGNWIDSMALLRRSSLLELGCFSTDCRLAGWEAFDLWCKCAEAGGYGAHVPQVLAWRRQAGDEAADDPDRWPLMRERYPRLLDVSDLETA